MVIVFLLSLLFIGNTYAQVTNPSSNVQNGSIWRYGNAVGVHLVDQNFSLPLAASEVRISQQIIDDLGNGLFDVEVKVQKGASINQVYNEAIVFLLDESGSMGQAVFNQIKQACVEMVNQFPANINAEFGIVKFSSNASIVLGLTTDRTLVKNTLNNLPYSGGTTNLYDGFLKAETVLEKQKNPGPKHIMLITDGNPNMPAPTNTALTQALNKAADLKAKGIILNVAGFGSGVIPSFFTQISSSASLCQITTNFTQLRDLLVGANGFASTLIGDASKSVTISMASGVTFVKVVSNNGGAYSVSSPTGTLYWNSQSANNVSSVIYRIQLEELTFSKTPILVKERPTLKQTPIVEKNKFDNTILTEQQSFKSITLPKTKIITKKDYIIQRVAIPITRTVFSPISKSAVFNYVDANGKSRSESFDIPKARYPIKKMTLTIDDLIYSLKDLPYDGNEHPVSVTVKKAARYDGILTVEYNGSISPKPKEIGDYFVTVRGDETETYYAAQFNLGAFTISPNANLFSITVTGKKSSLDLPGDQYVYDILVPTHDNRVTITAIPADPRSTVTGTGVYDLQPNESKTVILTVTTVAGTKQVYTINLIRETGQGNNVIRL